MPSRYRRRRRRRRCLVLNANNAERELWSSHVTARILGEMRVNSPNVYLARRIIDAYHFAPVRRGPSTSPFLPMLRYSRFISPVERGGREGGGSSHSSGHFRIAVNQFLCRGFFLWWDATFLSLSLSLLGCFNARFNLVYGLSAAWTGVVSRSDRFGRAQARSSNGGNAACVCVCGGWGVYLSLSDLTGTLIPQRHNSFSDFQKSL